MCMATFIPAGIPIPYEGLENGAATNQDGHGWAIASGDGIEVGKSMFFEEALDDFVKARNEHGHRAVSMFHSRFATHGTINEFNVHPFWVTDSTVMCHNGILPRQWHPDKKDPRSDTRILADTTLPEFLNERGVPSRRGGKALGNLIGQSNKLVILSVASGEPTARIINAHQGEHAEGVWFSYTCYLPSRWTTWSPAEKTPWYSESIKCEICHGRGWVDIDSNVCDACGYCNDCFQKEEACQCWNGKPADKSWWESESNSKELAVAEFGWDY